MLQIINTSFNLTAFLLSGLLLVASILGGNVREKVFRWFLVIVLITFLGAPGDALIMLLSGIPGHKVYVTIRIIDVLNYGAMGPTLIAVGLYFYALLSPKKPVAQAFVYFHYVLAALVTAFVIAAQFAPIITLLDESNHYHKGSLFWVFELFPLLSLSACTILTLQSRRQLRRREWIALLSYTLGPMLCYIIETAVGGLWLAYLSSAIALCIIYMNIQLELRHSLIEKDAELAQGRIAMLLSQIQPHFVFNTLSSISEVCADNPMAQKSLITFSEYLRVNMDALTQKTPIPFQQELEHVRQYLWLEQLRFEDKLSVIYTIEESDFMLPVLTLQPIVENAVKHGITQKSGPGKVHIHTTRVDQTIRITVSDDGVGFDPDAPHTDARSHMGLDNVRARLADMCGGWLAVESVPGQGTRVTIALPGERRA